MSWGDAKARKVFRDEAQWASHEPLLHTDELRGIPKGLWCCTEDPFIGAAHKFAQVAKPEVVEFSEGAHTDKYWTRVLPEILKFTGTPAT